MPKKKEFLKMYHGKPAKEPNFEYSNQFRSDADPLDILQEQASEETSEHITPIETIYIEDDEPEPSQTNARKTNKAPRQSMPKLNITPPVNETEEERIRRTKIEASYYRKLRLLRQTPEQRQRRLKQLSDNQKRRLQNETPEQREKRLMKGRLYSKLKQRRKEMSYTEGFED